VHAQLSDSEGSALWIAARIAGDGGGSPEDYLDYAHRLAKTMSQYPASVQEKIFGFMPPFGGGGGDTSNSAEKKGNENGNITIIPAAALADSGLSLDEVFDALLSQSPLSDGDVLKMLEREPALEKEHLANLLYAQGKLNKGTLISALASSSLKIGPAELKALLISQSPLDKTVLKKVENTSNLSREDIDEVLAAQ
jgi:hypothetical protein